MRLNPIQGYFHRLPDGASMRYAVYEPKEPPCGTVLIAPGRREFIEKKHAEAGVAFLKRGYRVIHFEWRGQGLSDRLLSGKKRQRDHATTFDQHLRDLTSFYENVVAEKITKPFILHGHSLGGHLLLRWLAEYAPAPVAAALLTAPMQAIALPFFEAPSRGIARGLTKLGRGAHYAFFQRDYGRLDRSFRLNPLSGDPERFAIIERYFTRMPEMKVGGVTWGWLAAALDSMRKTRATGYLARIQTPVLILVGERDIVTPAKTVLKRLRPLPHRQAYVIKDSRHDVLNETDSCRAEAWKRIDGFLATRL